MKKYGDMGRGAMGYVHQKYICTYVRIIQWVQIFQFNLGCGFSCVIRWGDGRIHTTK